MKPDRDESEEERQSLSPFPRSFGKAFTLFLNERKVLSLKPFSPAWENAWCKVTNGQRQGTDLYPGARERYSHFKKHDGFHFLETLTDKGADPNLILCLCVKYLWNDNAWSKGEHEDPFIRDFQGFLEAVKNTRKYYRLCYVDRSTDPYPQWYREIIGGEPNEEVDRFLQGAEDKLSRFIGSKDFRNPGKAGKKPNEKADRTIFTVREDLKHRTGPQWETFWNLLFAASAVPMAKDPKCNKDSLIKPYIKSFQNNHPVESEAIKRVISHPALLTVLPF